MDAQTALDKLVEHLLGKEYYIVDPVGGNQARESIVNEICSRYPAVKEDPVDAYRRKHKKCKWCKHCDNSLLRSCYTMCRAKDIRIYADARRPFCSLFELKKENK